MWQRVEPLTLPRGKWKASGSEINNTEQSRHHSKQIRQWSSQRQHGKRSWPGSGLQSSLQTTATVSGVKSRNSTP